MGTRADFYIGRGENAEWLGSVAWDGYPEGIILHLEETEPTYPRGPKVSHKRGKWPEGKHLFDSKTEIEFRERLETFFQFRVDVSRPEDGWPWPWEDSSTTDYAYALDDGKVWASNFGRDWFDPKVSDTFAEGKKQVLFPNMKRIQNITLGKRSGVMVFAG